MRVAIMQPTYLPWCGYFDLIDRVDRFVFLDDVAFDKRSWQQRNRIRCRDGLSWLSVPVSVRGKSGQLLSEVEIAEPAFAAKHLRSIEHNYRRAPHFAAMYQTLKQVFDEPPSRLVELNIQLIDAMCEALGVATPRYRASALCCGGKRGEHLALLCEALGADRYVSPPGSAAYLDEDREAFDTRGIAVEIQAYEHPSYAQSGAGFVSHAAAIDVFAACGDATLEKIRSGRRVAPSLSEYLLEARGESLMEAHA